MQIKPSRQILTGSIIYAVDGNGTVNLPNLNRIYVEGLTINELTKLLNEKYQDYIIAPSVEILVLDYRPIRVVVNGEVETPGVHTLMGSIKLGRNQLDFSDINNNNSNLSLDTTSSYLRKIRTNPAPYQTTFSNQVKSGLLNNSIQSLNNFSTDDSNLNKTIPELNFFPTIFDAIKKADGVTFYSDLSKVKITRINSLSNGGIEFKPL